MKKLLLGLYKMTIESMAKWSFKWDQVILWAQESFILTKAQLGAY